ncbi:MAG: hypothetical protein RL095_1979 [Verrucomicrobiota bacterium]
MKAALMILLILLAWPGVLAAPAAESGQGVEPSASPGRWTLEQIQEWQGRTAWRLGANFLPSTAINQVEMWDTKTFDEATIGRELDLARDTGFNSLRVFLHDLSYAEDPAGFLKRMDAFLALCEARGIKPMFVFFDDCWLCPTQVPKLVPASRPGTHNSGWLQSPGSELVRLYPRDRGLQLRLRDYVKAVIGRYAEDPRVLAWDLYNEPGNRAHRRFDEQGREIPGERREETAFDGNCALLLDAFRWAREARPKQPLTSGVWSWMTPESHPVARIQLEQSDFISFHNYAPLKSLQATVASLRQVAAGRPLMCSEYMARPVGSTFEAILPYLASENISAFNWGFVDGKSQTRCSWGSWKHPELDPRLWFHDIYRRDGSPYRPAEVELIRKIAAAKQAGRPQPAIKGVHP